MSNPTDNAPVAHSAGAAEESRPSLSALLLDPSFWADWASVVGLVGLVIVFGIAQPVFLSVANLQALFLAAAILVVLSIGQTFVVATSGIDLSLAAAVMLGAIILGLVNAAGYGIFIACVLAVLATSAIGFLNGLIITAGKIPDFVVTLGTLSGITGLGLILSGGEPTMVGSTFLLKLASGSFGPFGYPVWVAIAAVIVAHIALYHTRFGVHLLATGGQAESAAALGIRTDLPFKEAKGQLVEMFEREYIEDLMRRHKMNLSAAAREAQIDRKHLRELIRKYGLDPRHKLDGDAVPDDSTED